MNKLYKYATLAVLLSWSVKWHTDIYCTDRPTTNEYTGEVIISTHTSICEQYIHSSDRQKLFDSNSDAVSFTHGCPPCLDQNYYTVPSPSPCCDGWMFTDIKDQNPRLQIGIQQ